MKNKKLFNFLQKLYLPIFLSQMISELRAHALKLTFNVVKEMQIVNQLFSIHFLDF